MVPASRSFRTTRSSVFWLLATVACGISCGPKSAPTQESDATTERQEALSCGVSLDCDDHNPCTADSCVSGTCSYAAANNGVACSNANPCQYASTAGHCSSSVCVGSGSGPNVDDGLTCTEDVCDAHTGQVSHSPSSQTGCCSPSQGFNRAATSVADSAGFLYSCGANAVQTGVATSPSPFGGANAGALTLLRGRVTFPDGTPVQGVVVSVVGHPEFGQTLTRTDHTGLQGHYDLVVAATNQVTLSFTKVGYLPVQRTLLVQPNQHVTADVTMKLPDANSMSVSLGSAAWQMVKGGRQYDSSGARSAVLLVPPNTSVTSPSGLGTAITVRATEFTVGTTGPTAMPGTIPPTSGYTYAVEYSVDEAPPPQQVTFNHPLFGYVENFLSLPQGSVVPSGYYDRSANAWMPSADGRIVKILSISGGLATISVNAAGTAATSAELSGLGITTGELQQLGGLYSVGVSLWRTQVPHFTPWDYNWGGEAPPGATGPDGGSGGPHGGDDGPDGGCKQNGSILWCEGQSLSESLPVAGTPFSLNYHSSRVSGRLANRTLTIPLTKSVLPPNLVGVNLTTTIAGQTISQEFPATANQTTTFTWNGNDAFGVSLQGPQPVTVAIGYEYQPVMAARAAGGTGAAFATIPRDTDTASVAGRQLIALTKFWSGVLGSWDATSESLGGWVLDIEHHYDPFSRTLYFGNGDKRTEETVPHIIETVVGNGTGGPPSSGVQATQTGLGTPGGMVVTADNTIYLTVGNGQSNLVTIKSDGVLRYVVMPGYTSDGDLALGPDGSIYFINTCTIQKYTPQGSVVKVVGGTCAPGPLDIGEGGPAIQAQIGAPAGLVVAPDGTLYFSDSLQCVRQVTPDGTLTTIVGNQGNAPNLGDGGFANQATISSPRGMALDKQGNLYVNDDVDQRIRRIDTHGIITTVVGTGTAGFSPDGTLAKNAALATPFHPTIGPDGSLYFEDTFNGLVRKVDATGALKTVAGTPNHTGTTCAAYAGDGYPATSATLVCPQGGLAFGPDSALYIGDGDSGGGYRVRAVGSSLPGYTGAANIQIASEDKSEVYTFDPSGRHLTTLDARTGHAIYTFNHESSSSKRLTSVVDVDGNATQIVYAYGGIFNQTAIISPHGVVTTFKTDTCVPGYCGDDGFITSYKNANGEEYDFGYGSVPLGTAGLLLQMKDPKGQVHVFQYDALGRIAADADPVSYADGQKNYRSFLHGDNTARVGTPSYSVSLTSATGQTSSYGVSHNANQSLKRSYVDPCRSSIYFGTNSRRHRHFDASRR